MGENQSKLNDSKCPRQSNNKTTTIVSLNLMMRWTQIT